MHELSLLKKLQFIFQIFFVFILYSVSVYGISKVKNTLLQAFKCSYSKSKYRFFLLAHYKMISDIYYRIDISEINKLIIQLHKELNFHAEQKQHNIMLFYIKKHRYFFEYYTARPNRDECLIIFSF